MNKIHRLKYLNYDKLIVLDQKEIDYSDRPEVTHKVKKLLFFLLREGFVKTFRKIQSKKNKLLQVSHYLTVLKIKNNGNEYYNFSIQTSKNIDEFVVENLFFNSSQFTLNEDLFSLQKEIFNQYNNHNSSTYKNTIHLVEIKPKSDVKFSEKGIFIYGLGDYSRVFVAPFLKKQGKLFCVDYKAPLAKYYKDKYVYDNYALTSQETYPSLSNTTNPLAIIATYHSDHTRIAKEIFKHNNNTKIFIEKPPIVTLTDLKNLITLYNKNANLDIGYNRRYIPLNQKIKEKIKNQTVIITISVKEILINKNHWYFWENQGTRITGNLTHWLDLATFWIDEIPAEINVISAKTTDETIAVSVIYSNGSLLNISVSDKGNSLRGVQEKIEIRTKNETFFIDDYIRFSHTKSNGKIHHKKYLKRLKGHENMYKHVVKWYEAKETPNYTVKDLIYTSILTFMISKMFKENIKTYKVDTLINSYLSLISK